MSTEFGNEEEFLKKGKFFYKRNKYGFRPGKDAWVSFMIPVADDEEFLRYLTYKQLVNDDLEALERRIIKLFDGRYNYKSYYKLEEVEPGFIKVTFFIPVDKTKYFYFCPKWKSSKPDFGQAFKRAEEELFYMVDGFCKVGRSLIIKNSSGEIKVLARNGVSEELREVIYE